MIRSISLFAAVACLLSSAALLTGCGAGGPTTYPVTGKVTAEGKPVDGGTLTFVPAATGPTAASAPVLAIVKPDGTFQVAAGAVAGKQTVAYSPPSIDAPLWDGKGRPPAPPKSPWDGLKPKVAEVEVKAGKNDLAIELVK